MKLISKSELREKTGDHNYILFRLGDNDFGGVLLEAVQYVFEKTDRELRLEEWQYWIPRIAESFHFMRGLPDMLGVTPKEREATLKYLSRMEISFHRTNPTYDADGGSVVACTNTKTAWLV